MTNMSGTFLNSGACDAGPQGEGKESPSDIGRLQAAGVNKYQPYPEYKDSGLIWLGYIPDGWEIKKLKYLGDAIIGLTYSPDEVVDEDGGTLVLRSSNIQDRKLALNDNVFVSKLIPSKLRLRKNDILICARNGSRALIGKNALIDESMEGATFGAFMSVFRSQHNEFLSKVFNSSLFGFQAGTFLTSTINQLTTGNLNSFEVPFPPDDERHKIAAFLDYETARIDQLIAKQQQLIELLKEKRQAVISHAVTKGLNPNAPMKDSGVEWLGQVPEHWGMTKVKHLCYVNDGNHGEEYPKENDYTTQELGVPFIRGGNMQRLSIVAEGMLYITKEKNDSMRKGRLEPEDILFMNRGEIGKLAKIPTSYAGANLNSQIAYLRCHKQKVVPDFMLFFLSSTNVQNMISSMKMGSVLTQFPIADIINISVPLPSQNEQQQIMHELSQNLEQFFGLEKKAEAAIYLMQERRTALISAAVTGKIDLRGWQPPKREEAA